jgi:hypothetical protein
MKTAMQEVIDFVNDINDNDRSGFDYYYQFIMNKLNELLEKEKEQIKKANMDGYKEGCTYHSFDHQPKTTEQYYNETYNQKSIDAAELLYNIVKKEVDELNKNLG